MIGKWFLRLILIPQIISIPVFFGLSRLFDNLWISIVSPIFCFIMLVIMLYEDSHPIKKIN